MTNNDKLVAALRYCISTPNGVINCKGCPFFGSGIDCQNKLHADAADAIEALQAQMPKRGEIVRCGECKWYQPDLCANPWGVCFHEDWVENNIGHTVDEDGFCYRGEREVQE